ncbi:uncharacterized protein MONOS_4585 [Monocercomonoides exilis]|uniref:uncharacterized protein n=1 Tax=Monocercomonoides exilis TaxID=2049356 RepID=UPI0035598B00|nr:hypothetical protein MONOS_4585 [Monocercomonoides exilis]|eukprot:MONOS_4585.1-p1 / transcript=MONOS_4585.1 / gene=MONOS_4585 / organism=Monocercomonoides_exilis_PA203 / gene_product=unspecified product / transcript_product=unspecified product / location=Mono_scaffold00123:73685-76675(-) / protein_length=901 / sequence_SO=supercontig / SO=protein_coding / is_pseudo=false
MSLRSSMRMDSKGFAKVTLAQHEIEAISMAQEDKLSYNVRLEEINASNKAEIQSLILESHKLIMHQVQRMNQHGMSLEDKDALIFRNELENEKLRQFKYQMEKTIIPQINTMMTSVEQMTKQLTEKDAQLDSKNKQIEELNNKVAEQSEEIQKSNNLMKTDIPEIKNELQKLRKLNLDQENKIKTLLEENEMLAKKAADSEAKAKQIQREATSAIKEATVAKLSEISCKATFSRMFTATKRIASFHRDLMLEKEQDLSYAAAEAILNEENAIANALLCGVQPFQLVSNRKDMQQESYKLQKNKLISEKSRNRINNEPIDKEAPKGTSIREPQIPTLSSVLNEIQQSDPVIKKLQSHISRFQGLSTPNSRLSNLGQVSPGSQSPSSSSSQKEESDTPRSRSGTSSNTSNSPAVQSPRADLPSPVLSSEEIQEISARFDAILSQLNSSGDVLYDLFCSPLSDSLSFSDETSVLSEWNMQAHSSLVFPHFVQIPEAQQQLPSAASESAPTSLSFSSPPLKPHSSAARESMMAEAGLVLDLLRQLSVLHPPLYSSLSSPAPLVSFRTRMRKAVGQTAEAVEAVFQTAQATQQEMHTTLESIDGLSKELCEAMRELSTPISLNASGEEVLLDTSDASQRAERSSKSSSSSSPSSFDSSSNSSSLQPQSSFPSTPTRSSSSISSLSIQIPSSPPPSHLLLSTAPVSSRAAELPLTDLLASASRTAEQLALLLTADALPRLQTKIQHNSQLVAKLVEEVSSMRADGELAEGNAEQQMEDVEKSIAKISSSINGLADTGADINSLDSVVQKVRDDCTRWASALASCTESRNSMKQRLTSAMARLQTFQTVARAKTLSLAALSPILLSPTSPLSKNRTPTSPRRISSLSSPSSSSSSQLLSPTSQSLLM